MVKNKKTIGILALQGCVTPHKLHLNACNVLYKEIRTQEDIYNIDAYILPGGESSTILKLIHTFALKEELQKEFSKKPVWGICAGSILMARTVTNPQQISFNLLDINIKRNGYGRQINSFTTTINNYPVSFIRAPIIQNVNNDTISLI